MRWLLFLMTFAVAHSFVHSQQTETLEVPPLWRFEIQYDWGNRKANSFVIKDKLTDKKTKVSLPHKDFWINDRMAPVSNQIPVIKIPIKIKEYRTPDHFMLLRFNEDGSHSLLTLPNNTHEEDKWLFLNAYSCHQFIIVNDWVLTPNGKWLENTVKPKVYPSNELYECYGWGIRVNYKDRTEFYGQKGQPLKFPLSSNINLFIDKSPILVVFSGDSLFFYNANTNSVVGRYASQTPFYMDQFTTLSEGHRSNLVKKIAASNRFPIRVDEKRFAYVDANQNTVIPPFEAEEALPFFLPKDDNPTAQAAIKVNGKWGTIDASGQMAIRPRFDFLRGNAYETSWEFHIRRPGMERSDSINAVDDDDGTLIVTWPEKPSIMPVNRPTGDFTVTYYYRCGVDFYPKEFITPVEVSVRGNKAYISDAGSFEIVSRTYIYDQGKACSEYSFSHPTYLYMVFSPNMDRMVLTTTSGMIGYCVD